jgi:hypothetical protein
MSLTNALAEVAPNVSNSTLGTIAQAFDADALGAALRPLLGSFEPAATEAAVSGIATKSPTIPESPVARTALLDTIYGSFGTYRRRTVSALARSTGLTNDAVLELIEGNTDFRVSTGRNSGDVFISINRLAE